MSDEMRRAADLIDGLQFIDDAQLIEDDIVGCLANACDVPPDALQTPSVRTR